MSEIDFNPSYRETKYFEQPYPSRWERLRSFSVRTLGLEAAYVNGIDISKWQGDDVNFQQVKAAGYEFVIMKASDGLAVDPRFNLYWPQALDAGLIPGAYHFFRGNVQGQSQADFHLNTIAPLMGATKKILPSHADVESSDGVTVTTRRNRLRDCLAYWNTNWKEPGVYSSVRYWQELLGNANLLHYGWAAHWTSASKPAIPVGWDPEKVKLWQWGVAGKYDWCPPNVPGVPGACDVNRFLGTYEELLAFAGFQEVPEPPEECPCQEQIDEINETINTLASQIKTEINKIHSTLGHHDEIIVALEDMDLSLSGEIHRLAVRVTALEEGGAPDPPEPEYVTYVVTADKAVARYIVGYNNSNLPVMAIWGETASERVRFNNGEKFRAYPEIVDAEGPDDYVMLWPTERPAGAPDLFIQESRVRVI
ncbi:MAG: hypothetical protein KAS38_05325 [Anaerolineales bacterium]|nr:hypothetical protein [Anaerolineales bacterium]